MQQNPISAVFDVDLILCNVMQMIFFYLSLSIQLNKKTMFYLCFKVSRYDKVLQVCLVSCLSVLQNDQHNV